MFWFVTVSLLLIFLLSGPENKKALLFSQNGVSRGILGGTDSAGNILATQQKVRKIQQKHQAETLSNLTQVRAKQEATKHTSSLFILFYLNKSFSYTVIFKKQNFILFCRVIY